MSPPLLMATVSDASARAAALAGLLVGVGALASVLRVWIEQVSRTRRLNRALMDSDPSERAEIIKACSVFERKSLDRVQPAPSRRDEIAGRARRRSRD